MNPESFTHLLKARHSVRQFKPDQIPDDLLTKIVEAATMTPSWCNSQPWAVTIATGESMKTIRNEYLKLAEAKTEPRPDVPPLHRTDVSPLSQKSMTEFFGEVGKLNDPLFGTSQPSIFNAPAVAYFTLPKAYSPYSVLDIGAYYMNLMLAAKTHGIDSIPAAATIIYCDVLHRVLSIPEDQVIFIGVALGYPADAPINSFVPTRQPVSEILSIKH